MQENKVWTRTSFQFHEQLGAGSHGAVYRATEKESQTVVAIKLIPKRSIVSPVDHKRLQREVEIQYRMRYKSICRLYGYFLSQTHVHLVMEYCANMSLYVPIKLNKEVFSDKKIASIFRELVSAVAYMSERKVMHRDIKLENILLDSNYNVKITDFGLSIHTTELRSSGCGTKEYLCPEIIKHEKYGHEIDIYCLGVVLYELYFFKSPFYDPDTSELYHNIQEGVVIFEDEIRVISDSAKSLICSLLGKGKNRPSIKEILSHPYLEECLGKTDSQQL